MSKAVEEILLKFKVFSGCVEGPYLGEVEVSGCAEEERCVEA